MPCEYEIEVQPPGTTVIEVGVQGPEGPPGPVDRSYTDDQVALLLEAIDLLTPPSLDFSKPKNAVLGLLLLGV